MSSGPPNFTANSKIAQAFEKHRLYPDFLNVKNQLAKKGYVCWVAGGAVRDLLLNRQVADFDLVTDATTEQIMQIFPHALTVGASFGVVKLVLDDKSIFDLATFRRESDYVDGRRPSKIDYATPEEDAGRRDFTVNALFWDDQQKQVVDFVGGLRAIEEKVLQCVGDADVRFQEDHLRILRLLRFSVQLNFTPEKKTLQAALSKVELLQKISAERIWAEFEKMLPYVNWNDFLKQPLALKIFKHLFSGAFDSIRTFDLNRLDKVNADAALLKFYMVLLADFTSGPFEPFAKDLRNKLKTRLKVGSDALKEFDALAFAVENGMVGVESTQDSFQKLSFAQWAVEIERNELILESLTFLKAIELFDAALLTELKHSHENPPPKLVDGNDLLDKIEKQKIGDTLKRIRLLQYEQPSLTKVQILNAVGIDSVKTT